MKQLHDHFINATVIDGEKLEILCNDGFETSLIDPLLGTGTGLDGLDIPEYYKLDDVVFAEPIPIQSALESETEYTNNMDEIKFIGNIGVQRTVGKRNNKYFMDIQDKDNPTCPQQNCMKKFNTTINLKAHVRKVHCANKTSFVCEVCGAGFAAKYLLKRHTLTHGGSKRQCPVCEKMLSPRTNLSIHLRSHADVRPHACEKCRKRFVRKCTLTRHVQFVHRDEI